MKQILLNHGFLMQDKMKLQSNFFFLFRLTNNGKNTAIKNCNFS